MVCDISDNIKILKKDVKNEILPILEEIIDDKHLLQYIKHISIRAQTNRVYRKFVLIGIKSEYFDETKNEIQNYIRNIMKVISDDILKIDYITYFEYDMNAYAIKNKLKKEEKINCEINHMNATKEYDKIKDASPIPIVNNYSESGLFEDDAGVIYVDEAGFGYFVTYDKFFYKDLIIDYLVSLNGNYEDCMCSFDVINHAIEYGYASSSYYRWNKSEPIRKNCNAIVLLIAKTIQNRERIFELTNDKNITYYYAKIRYGCEDVYFKYISNESLSLSPSKYIKGCYSLDSIKYKELSKNYFDKLKYEIDNPGKSYKEYQLLAKQERVEMLKTNKIVLV